MIEAAKADGSDAKWTGTVPTGPCHWTGTNPGNVTLPTWKPILLTSPGEFRPPPPPDCRSEAVRAQTEAIRKYGRTFVSNSKAYFWQSPAGLMTGWYDYASKWLFEDKTDQNPPRAARAYALLATIYYDAFLASNDASTPIGTCDRISSTQTSRYCLRSQTSRATRPTTPCSRRHEARS